MTMTVQHTLSMATNPVAPVAHETVTRARGGDPDAQAAILNAVSAARAPGAAPAATLIADTLSAADKLQTQAGFVAKWFGVRAGQAIARGHHLAAAHVA